MGVELEEQTQEQIEEQWKRDIQGLNDQEIEKRIEIFTNNIRIMNQDVTRVQREAKNIQKDIDDNMDKIKRNKQMPYLVSNIVEVLDPSKDEVDELLAEGQVPSKSVVIKTSTRHTIYLPVSGLIDEDIIQPTDIVGVNKDSYLLLDKLPTEFDSRVKAMELDEKPSEEYTDIGGLDKQIEELREAVVLPITHADKFKNIGIRPPKGVLMHGPPGTGKTMLARACAAQTSATFLKLAGTSLVQMYIGDGAKMVRDAFALAKEKAPTIIFIDELDAIGTKRFGSDKSGDREVQRTMLELLNQLDGFSPDDRIKVVAATNRPDTLDPALLRSGRLDRKIEFPLPNEEARAQILKIHSRKMNLSKEINFTELARSSDTFNGAQVKAICVEAGMVALRHGHKFLTHEDYVEGILAVQSKKKKALNYYA